MKRLDMEPLSVPLVFGCARWIKDWSGWGASIQDVVNSIGDYLPLPLTCYNVRMDVSPLWRDRATSMASSWIENCTDKDRLLLKHRLCPLFPV